MADNNESRAEPSSCGKRSALSKDESPVPKVETQVHVAPQDLEYVRKEVLPRLAGWIKKRVLEVKRATMLDFKNSEGKAQNGETSSNPSMTKLESITIPSKIINNEEGKNGEEIEELHLRDIEIEEEEEGKGAVTEAIPLSIYTTPLQEVKSAIELELENSEMKNQNGEMNPNSSMELQATKLESTPSNIINVEKENINGRTIIDEIDSYLLMHDEELEEQEGDEMSLCYSFQQEFRNLMKLDSANSEEKTQEKVMDSSFIEEVKRLESAPSKMINVEEENNGGERDAVQSTPMVDAGITQERQKEEGAMNAIPIFIYSNPAQEKEMNSNSTAEVTRTDSIPSKIVIVEEENNGGGKDEVQPTPMVDADVTQEQQRGVIDAIPISIYSNPAQIMKPWRMKQPAILLGESPMVFQIPQAYVQYLAAIDQVVACHPEYPGTVFMKRLDGWTIQQKRRANGLVDAYYLHKEAKKVFRSSKEVADFIVYSIIREKPTQSAAKRRRLEQEPNPSEQRSGVATMSPAGEQDASAGKYSDEEVQPLTAKEVVERFLRESWENLQKLGKPPKTSKN